MYASMKSWQLHAYEQYFLLQCYNVCLDGVVASTYVCTILFACDYFGPTTPVALTNSLENSSKMQLARFLVLLEEDVPKTRPVIAFELPQNVVRAVKDRRRGYLDVGRLRNL